MTAPAAFFDFNKNKMQTWVRPGDDGYQRLSLYTGVIFKGVTKGEIEFLQKAFPDSGARGDGVRSRVISRATLMGLGRETSFEVALPPIPTHMPMMGKPAASIGLFLKKMANPKCQEQVIYDLVDHRGLKQYAINRINEAKTLLFCAEQSCASVLDVTCGAKELESLEKNIQRNVDRHERENPHIITEGDLRWGFTTKIYGPNVFPSLAERSVNALIKTSRSQAKKPVIS